MKVELLATLKVSTNLTYQKGSVFTDPMIPEAIRKEIRLNTGTVRVVDANDPLREVQEVTEVTVLPVVQTEVEIPNESEIGETSVATVVTTRKRSKRKLLT